MGYLIVEGALLRCSLGTAPASLGVPSPQVKVCKKPAANTLDNQPGLNIRPFGLCRALANPAVASATAAALGVLTPQPCAPVTAVGPWAPGRPRVAIRKQPAVDDGCTLGCAYGGVIEVNAAGQVLVRVK